jgi:hypothetical protein
MGGTHPARRFEMRRGFGWGVAILAVLLAVGVGVAAYNWGVSDGIEQSGKAVEVVRYVGHGFGFFPFFLFFPLLFLAIFAFKGWGWRRHGHEHGHGPGGRGPWESRFEDWHREQHQTGSGAGTAGGAGGEPV